MTDSRSVASRDIWVKRTSHAPDGFVETEAAGLRWLAEAGGVPVVEVLDVAPQALTLRRLHEVSPTPAAAHTFGVGLGRLHNTPAETFGALPPGAAGYFFGPVDSPLSLPTGTSPDFGEFYATNRIEPLVELCRDDGTLQRNDLDLLGRICSALRSGNGPRGGPSRVHGDLWSGNVLWTADGATLIDPAACGHHPMADIAMLLMFGAPHLDAVLDGYATSRPLPTNWRESVGLHQLFGYLVHLHLFGTGYLSPTVEAARSAAVTLGV